MKNTKLSELAKARWADPDTRARIIEAMNNRSPEDKAIAAAALKTAAEHRWADPETAEALRSKMTEGQLSAWADPDKKARRLAKRRATLAAKKAKLETENG